MISVKKAKTKWTKSGFLWYLFLAVFILFYSYYVSNTWYSIMLIQGDSMLPTYHDMQFVMLDRHSKEYSYGDVIAFQCDELSSILVKRIAACPEDVVAIIDGTLYVNGRISAVYPQKEYFTFAGELGKEITLDAGEYIVLGDNSAVSKDSRYEAVGCIEEEDILGIVVNSKE